MKQRVVITGLGAVTGIGHGVERFTEGLRNAECAASEIRAFDTQGFASRRGCEVKNFDPREWVSYLDPDALGRSSQFSIAAARMALGDAAVDVDSLSDVRCGVSMGTTDGESQVIDQLALDKVRGGLESAKPKLFPMVGAENISFSVAREFGLYGGAVTLPTACAAGNYAIGLAYDRISMGEVDMMVCGGADSMCRKTFAGFYRLGTIAPEVCQPFDRDRRGILTGEGAGVLLLESLDAAKARGARIYAEVLGYGMNCDADHMVAPNRERIADCMRLAHTRAGVTPQEIDWISAHGTGTVANDVTESGAVLEVFGDSPPPVTSVKSMIGHTMGAASALASVACAVGIHHGFIPPTINHREPDPACPIDCVPNEARAARLRVVQNNGFAFGGNNCITIFGRLAA